jgi:bifunctional lysine-specific demethylase and histidyl-hydroxylase MINA
LAISHLRHSLASLDFSQPGGHIAVHPGVERELQFIASTQSFRVAEVPGGSSGDVKIALVNKLVDSGFLEVAD